jgi:hypothetical protein
MPPASLVVPFKIRHHEFRDADGHLIAVFELIESPIWAMSNKEPSGMGRACRRLQRSVDPGPGVSAAGPAVHQGSGLT